jgi:hypothetical protein
MNEDDPERMEGNPESLGERIAELETELSGKRGEVETLRAARARDAAALAERDQERAELETQRKHIDDLEAQLDLQRTRGDELAGLLATERSWGDELERLLAAARARGDKLERELAEARHEATAAEGRGDGDISIGTPQTSAEPGPEAETGAAAPESSAAVPDPSPASPGAGGTSEPATAAAAAGTPRWSHAAQLTLTAAQAGCLSWVSVLTESVRVIGSEGGWDAVIAWVLDHRDDRYTCRAAWCRAPDEMARFETSMWQVRQAASGSPVGAAAAAAEPAWLRGFDTAADPHLISVARAGLKTLALLPVRHDLETVAVLELCARAEVDRDPELKIALEVIAAGLANVHQLLVASGTPRWTSGGHRL